MDTNKPSNTIAIIGLVIGALAVSISFISFVGTMAFIPGIVGAIFGLISLLKAKDNGHPTGLSTAAIAISLVACAISLYQIFAFQNMTSEMKSNLTEYTNCEDLKTHFKQIENELGEIVQEMEDSVPSLSQLSIIFKLGFKLENIQEQSEKLGCNIDFEDMDFEDADREIGEGAGENVGDGDVEEADEDPDEEEK